MLMPLPNRRSLIWMHLAAQTVIALDHVGHFVTGIHHRGVIAPAQRLADLGQGDVGFFAHQVHGHLARQGHFSRAVAAEQAVSVDAEGSAARRTISSVLRFDVRRCGSRSARAV